MSDLRLRARSSTELVDAAFALYRRDPLPYILLTAFAYAPWLVLQLLITGGRVGVTGMNLVLILGTIIAYSIMSAALVRLASNAYLGEPMDLGAAIGDALPRVPSIIVAAIVKALLLGIGFALFLVGMLYVAARFFALNEAIILEHRGVGEAFARSGELSRGRKWHILGTLALVMIIYLLLSMAVTFAAALSGSEVVTVVLSTAYVVVAYPLFGITETLLYYDARIRGEGYDIELMAGALGGPGTAESAAH